VRLEHTGDGFRARFFAMGGPCEVLAETRIEGEAARLGQLAAEEAWRVEDKYSRYLDGNIVARINSAAGASVEVDDETARLIDFAVELHALSDGRFDITSGALRSAWTFDGSDRVPDACTVARALRRVGWDRAEWDGRRLRMPAGMEIDLGGICKEYAVDRAARLLREAGPASVLVNFGGDLAVGGSPVRRPAWKVGIESVETPGANATRLIDLVTGGLATSGDARRFIIRDGVRYGHILDPRTGWPIAGAPRSVTVAADTCTQAGMLSTLAMLAGDEAERFLGEQGVRYWVLR
jgi:thiamine biosynthesis lipoprotein